MADPAPAIIAAHTAAIYLFLIGAIRLLGLRQLGQITVIDLVVVLVIGSAVETSMVAQDTSLVAGLVSAGTLLALNRVVSAASLRSRRLRRAITGGPVLLVQNGHILPSHLRKVGMTEADVREALREREVDQVEEVRFAVLEPDGQIDVVLVRHKTHVSAIARDSPSSNPSPPTREADPAPRDEAQDTRPG